MHTCIAAASNKAKPPILRAKHFNAQQNLHHFFSKGSAELRHAAILAMQMFQQRPAFCIHNMQVNLEVLWVNDNHLESIHGLNSNFRLRVLHAEVFCC